MEKIEISVNGNTYLVEVADTEETREQGLQDRYTLAKNKGMLFVFDEPEEVSMWMKNTRLSLDIIFINEERQVISNKFGEFESLELLTEDSVKYVLEVNINSGIKEGDIVDLSELDELYDDSDEDYDDNTFKIEIEITLPEKEEPINPLLILDDKGRVQMQLKGGERIFSRKNTKTLISMAKRAWMSKEDKDYRSLGRKVFSYLEYQDNKEDDYVEIKN